MERIWDLALRHPLPHQVPCYPRGGGQRGRAVREARLGEGKEGRRDERSRCPPRGPSATCPPPPTAAPLSFQGRGRSSSERSVRPTEPLKGAGANQRASEECGGSLRFIEYP